MAYLCHECRRQLMHGCHDVVRRVYWVSCFEGMARVLKDQWLSLTIATTSLVSLVWLELFAWSVH